MNKLLTLLIVFLSFNAFSQVISGVVRDHSSLKEIAYASVYYKKVNTGTYTDSTGKFTILKISGDTLIISSLGFEKFLVPSNDTKEFLNVSLIPATIELNEIEVTGTKLKEIRKGKNVVLGNLSNKRDVYISGMKGRTVAYLVKNDHPINGIIKTLHFGIRAEAPATMRIHLYTADSNSGKPGKELLLKPVFLKVKKGARNLIAELTHLNIELPSTGVFVGLEWIGEINNSKSVNISPFYTLSNSMEPTIVYIKFMDKSWLLSKRKATVSNLKKQLPSGSEYFFDEPNFKITIAQ